MIVFFYKFLILPRYTVNAALIVVGLEGAIGENNIPVIRQIFYWLQWFNKLLILKTICVLIFGKEYFKSHFDEDCNIFTLVATSLSLIVLSVTGFRLISGSSEYVIVSSSEKYFKRDFDFVSKISDILLDNSTSTIHINLTWNRIG